MFSKIITFFWELKIFVSDTKALEKEINNAEERSAFVQRKVLGRLLYRG